MAGWIALRHLKDAKPAEKHFDALRSRRRPAEPRPRRTTGSAAPPRSWATQARAREYYKAAAIDFDTFHGLLALQKLDLPTARHRHQAAGRPDSRRSRASPSSTPPRRPCSPARPARAVAVTRVFLLNLAQRSRRTRPRAAMAAHLARGAGRHADGRAHRQGRDRERAEPRLLQLPGARAAEAYTPLRPPPETAHALWASPGRRPSSTADRSRRRARAASCRS